MDPSKCASPEQFELILNDPKIAAKKGDDLYSAEAFAIWGCLGKKDQEDWKSQFNNWKTTQQAGAVPAALGADISAGSVGAYASATPADVNSILDSASVPF